MKDLLIAPFVFGLIDLAGLRLKELGYKMTMHQKHVLKYRKEDQRRRMMKIILPPSRAAKRDLGSGSGSPSHLGSQTGFLSQAKGKVKSWDV